MGTIIKIKKQDWSSQTYKEGQLSAISKKDNRALMNTAPSQKPFSLTLNICCFKAY